VPARLHGALFLWRHRGATPKPAQPSSKPVESGNLNPLSPYFLSYVYDEPMNVRGKSIYIVKRGFEGAWKMTHLIDNSDGATTAETTPKNGNPDAATNPQV